MSNSQEVIAIKANIEKDIENKEILMARQHPDDRNRFLEDHQNRILAITAKILKRHISRSDDEYIIGLTAVSSAIDSYQEDKGSFWSYAAVVIRNRLIDYHRSEKKHDHEILASQQVFDGTMDYEDPEYLLQEKISRLHHVSADQDLKLEIEALDEELSLYGISFFDLAAASPKAQKTRHTCAQIIKAFFLPPPLLDYLEKKRRFPGAEINKRVKNAKKCIERYKKYLISIVVIIKGDYPGIAEYISYITDELKEGGDI